MTANKFSKLNLLEMEVKGGSDITEFANIAETNLRNFRYLAEFLSMRKLACPQSDSAYFLYARKSGFD